MTDAAPLLVASGLEKVYRRWTVGGTVQVPVLAGADLVLARGERVAIQGDSGVGKTTLLNVLGGLDRPDAGSIVHLGREIPADAGERARWRRSSVGFVFQFHGLLAEFTAEENVALAGLIRGWSRREALRRALSLLDALGLAARAEHYPAELSGGEQQRVAIARAVVCGPSLVLADEPTGNLDPRTGDAVLDRLIELQERDGFGLVVATHSARLARRCHRTLRLVSGRLEAAEAVDLTPRPEGAGDGAGR